MPRYVILRQSHTPEDAFGPMRETLRQHHCRPDDDTPPLEWVALPENIDQRSHFTHAADFLASHLHNADSLTALVDEVDVSRLNPLSNTEWSGLIAMLILAFPEVRWVFRVIARSAKDRDYYIWESVSNLHGSQTMAHERGSPLFDSYGLRQVVRERIRLDETDSHDRDRLPMPHRQNVAVVLDDETGFSQFEALMAYTRGFRVHAISSWNEALRLLGRDGLLVAPRDSVDVPVKYSHALRMVESSAFQLSLEDFFVSLPDQNREHLSDLEERSQNLPGLGRPDLRRRFVTVGHEEHWSRNSEKKAARKRQLAELRQQETAATGFRLRRGDQLVYKPASGLYTLWDELGLKRAFPRREDDREYRGCAPGYFWPPRKGKDANSDNFDDTGGHSAPGRLVQIAESLLARASALIEEVNTVSEAVRGAVLATQALELLGCKTPTLSLDALSLKHRFEVCAECHFVGVEYHLSIHERLVDIRRNLESLSHWLHKSRKNEFVLNGEAKIVTRLIAILEDHGAFEESETCRERLRELHNQIVFRAAWRDGKVLRIASRPFSLYMDFVLRSSAHFMCTIFTALAVFTLLFMWAEGKQLAESFYTAFRAMVGERKAWADFTSTSPKEWLVALNCTAAAFGLFNFGILISHLYSKIVRK